MNTTTQQVSCVCAHCGASFNSQFEDTACPRCEDIATRWYEWGLAFRQPLSAGLGLGMPLWVLDYWND